ncbi:hypothetical protein CRYUN_Cryun22dG0020300 [Craigia yunnanensis]
MVWRWRYCYKDVLPFTVMVTMECANVGLHTLFKPATLNGMSYHVFVVYAYAIAAFVLLPAPFFSYRSRLLPPLSFPILCKIGLLGLIGSLSQIMRYTGINYSSPILASAISNLTPAFTFILAIIFRFSSVNSFHWIMYFGSEMFSFCFWMGPAIVIASTPSASFQQPLNSSKTNLVSGGLHSANSDWVIGGIFLTAEYILVPLWYIVQTQIMKEYPAELTVVFFHNLCVSFFTAIVGLASERNARTLWFLLEQYRSYLSSALEGTCFLAMFKPLSIAIAVAMGVMFLGDTLHLGSLVGATIISIGFYTVMWGKEKEEMADCGSVSGIDSTSSHRVPLLQSYKNEKV